MFSMIGLFFLGAATADTPTRTTVGCINEGVSDLSGAKFSLKESCEDIEWQIAQREKDTALKSPIFDLSLADNYITDEGIDELCTFVTKFFHNTDRKLHTLSLANNRITERGALRLLNLLRAVDLKEIDLSTNYITTSKVVAAGVYTQYQSSGKTIIL